MVTPQLEHWLPIIKRWLHTPLFTIGLVGFCVLLLTNVLQQQQQTTLLETRTQHYGQALTRLAAKQAIDATLNHDLISLQVALQDITQNPDILNATIHDVENRLLVQAGSAPNLTPAVNPDIYRSYTSAITLHDSVAGYVTVTIDTKAIYQQQEDAWFFGLATLFVTLLGWSLLNPPPTTSLNTSEKEPQEAELPQRGSHNADDVQVNLLLKSSNIKILKEQLGSSKRDELFAALEGQLNGINTLYSGRIISASDELIAIEFSDSESGNAYFRAICAAQLLFSLQEKTAGLKIEFSAAVMPKEAHKSLSSQIQHNKFTASAIAQLQHQASRNLIISCMHIATTRLQQRLNTEDLDGNWELMTSLKPSYQALIEKQVTQLQDMLAHAS